MKFSLCLLSLLFFLTSCQKHYVSVLQESVGKKNLASFFTKTPDFRLKEPPSGEKLLIEWNLKEEVMKKELVCRLSLFYKNYTVETLYYPVLKKRGVISYFLLGEKFLLTKGLLTYKAEIVTKEGDLVQKFEQQLFTKLITIKED